MTSSWGGNQPARPAPASPAAAAGSRPAIVTPDAVGLDVDIATVGSRGVAYFVDLAIFLAVLIVLTVAQAVLGGAGFVPGWFAIAVLLLLAFMWQFGYPIGFETLWRGRTPGKAVMGLRVVTVEGAPIGLRHATVRAAVGVIELLFTVGAIAIITSLVSSRSQRLGDLGAGTLVVRERRATANPVVEVFVPPPGFTEYAARLDVHAVGPAEYAAIRETLRRAHELPPQVARRVTAELAQQLVGRVRPAPPSNCGPWEFLLCVAAAVQARRAPLGATPPPVPGAPGVGVPGSGGPSGVASSSPPRSPQSPPVPTSPPSAVSGTGPPPARPRPPSGGSGPGGTPADRPGETPGGPTPGAFQPPG